jgi:6-phosphogluconolactonase
VTGKLSANETPFVSLQPGSGPRHFAFHPAGRYAYVINEMNSTVTALAYDAAGGILEPIQTESTLPDGFEGNNSTAEVQVHPTGKFLYGSNRGHDSIVVFAIDSDTGKLAYVENESTGGRTPRNFGLDPTGTCLLAANQNSNTVVVFRIDPRTGALEPTGHTADVPTPVCVKIMRPSR